jgi:hypothetical protein
LDLDAPVLQEPWVPDVCVGEALVRLYTKKAIDLRKRTLLLLLLLLLLLTSRRRHSHPAHPPNNDFPTSWTVDPELNPYYWGNGNPIGDAGGCDARTTDVLLKESWGSSAVCTDRDDAASMNVADNKTAPQGSQGVEYDFRCATRTIEYFTHAKQAGKPFFVGVGFRRPHLQWRQPRQFYELYAGANLSVAKHWTIGQNITTLAYRLRPISMAIGTLD